MSRPTHRPIAAAVIVAGLASLLAARPSLAYSVLAHESNIDTAWDNAIVPVLRQRFPRVSLEELSAARAYAYGGCVIQDLGYYPFGSHFFSDLLHYVRTGDFVESLIREARDVNELAFALGALAHYTADSDGHAIAVNPSVAIIYPKLRAKFGDRVTYEQAPARHVMVEFSFDVVQAATGNYASDAYHQFIGFEVATPVLERAFLATYGLEMKDLFDTSLAIGTYRQAVSSLIPEMTKVAWRDKRDDIVKASPQIQQAAFVYTYSQEQYDKEFGTHYIRPRWYARLIGFLLKLLPKFGPFRPLAFKPPTAETESLFLTSLDKTRDDYRASLSASRQGQLRLPNRNLDTGRNPVLGEYALADKTYEKLLDKLADRKFAGVPPALAKDIAVYFGEAQVLPGDTSRRHKRSARVRERLASLRLQVSPAD
jgi:Zinc dependent phospholipase C